MSHNGGAREQTNKLAIAIVFLIVTLMGNAQVGRAQMDVPVLTSELTLDTLECRSAGKAVIRVFAVESSYRTRRMSKSPLVTVAAMAARGPVMMALSRCDYGVIEKTVPSLNAPPCAVVPYSVPLTLMRPAPGPAPSWPLPKECSTASVPSGAIENTVPPL